MAGSVEAVDDTLVARFRAGERHAFEEVVRRHESSLFNFARTMVRSPSIAEDIVQQTFVRAVAHHDDAMESAKFAPWLYGIARVLSLDHLRKARDRNLPSLDEASRGDADRDGPSFGDGDSAADPSAGAGRDALGHELRLRIAAAVDALPDDQREVFCMRELASIPFHQIAEIIDTPENIVKTRMRCALERLQFALQGDEEHGRERP